MSVMGIPMGRRCAIVKNKQGKLVVFSPLEATPEVLAELRELGEVAAFVIPSLFHDHFYDAYFSEFPQARFLGSAAVIKAHPKWPLTELTAATPELAGIQSLMLQGMPQVQEQVFYHEASRSLITADSVFFVPGRHGFMHRLLLKLAGIGAKVGPSRLFQSMIRDRPAFTASLQQVLAWEFDRIIPGHGEVIDQNARDQLRQGYAAYL